MLRRIIPGLAVLAIAMPALAHPGHPSSGFLHPLSGADHVLAMTGVGLWAALLAARRPAAAILLPASFLVMMTAGAAAGFSGIELPLGEAVIGLSVVAVGLLVAAAVRLPVLGAMAVVGLFALYHGHAHALEAPAGDHVAYVAGFLLASALLQAAGLGVGWLARRRFGAAAQRALGGAVMAGGALALIAG
jgi:urease accessory protein